MLDKNVIIIIIIMYTSSLLILHYDNLYDFVYQPLLVRRTHQSMPIMMTLSPEMRVSVPTVGGIQLVLTPRKITSIVMELSSN